ncbi:MAG: hypothetical protein NT122_07580 [Solirubrobacterales bacterium]|nr:hypothetical protein [Solirubrobacterales bacterium]
MEAVPPPEPEEAYNSRSLRPMIAKFRGSETGTAAILAGAMILTNVVALLATIAFGRLLGLKGYGELAAILSTFVILSVPGAALQVATAREGALGHLGQGREFATTLKRWTITLALLTVVVAVVSILLRAQLASMIGVTQKWGAAAVPPAACLWILLSIQRGALQATRSYMAVGMSMIAEQTARLVFGAGLALVGFGVTGAYLGTPIAMMVTSLILTLVLSGRLGKPNLGHTRHRLRQLALDARVAIAGLALIAVLQNIDVIVAQHVLPKSTAGAYAAAAVAAKVVVWVAVGIGFYLLPEAARRHAEGDDARPILLRALGMTALIALPCLLIYAFAPELLMRLAFGPKYTQGASVLLELGIAMSLLAVCYLAVQLLLALREWKFLIALAAVAIAEPVALLSLPGGGSLEEFATVVLGIQAVAAIGSMILAYRASRPSRMADRSGASNVQAPNRATTL